MLGSQRSHCHNKTNSPTWAVLRALQQINSTTRIEGEAAMSAHPFFQSAGRGIYSSGGGEEGPTVVCGRAYQNKKRKEPAKMAKM